jgi:hypothetical protein
LLASRRLPDDILVVVTEMIAPPNEEFQTKQTYREVRVIVTCGNARLGSFIAKNVWLN